MEVGGAEGVSRNQGCERAGVAARRGAADRWLWSAPHRLRQRPADCTHRYLAKDPQRVGVLYLAVEGCVTAFGDEAEDGCRDAWRRDPAAAAGWAAGAAAAAAAGSSYKIIEEAFLAGVSGGEAAGEAAAGGESGGLTLSTRPTRDLFFAWTSLDQYPDPTAWTAAGATIRLPHPAPCAPPALLAPQLPHRRRPHLLPHPSRVRAAPCHVADDHHGRPSAQAAAAAAAGGSTWSITTSGHGGFTLDRWCSWPTASTRARRRWWRTRRWMGWMRHDRRRRWRRRRRRRTERGWWSLWGGCCGGKSSRTSTRTSSRQRGGPVCLCTAAPSPAQR